MLRTSDVGTRPLALAFSAAFIALSAGCAGESGVQGTSPRQAYIDRLGVDTISVEVYSRTANGFEGDLLVRSPVTRVAHYRAWLTPAGTVEKLDVEWRTPAENPEGPPPLGFTIAVEGDSATIDVRSENPVSGRVAVPPGVIPTVGGTPITYAVMEQAVRQAMAGGQDSFPVYFLSARGRVSPNAIVRFAKDSVSLDFFGNPILAKVGPDGALLGRSGLRTTMKAVGAPAPDVDLGALASDFAARDAQGAGMGVPSPQDTVEATVGGANLKIVYSRPAKRGREIWGGLVPWDEVWRTGANAATSFTTDRDLEVGGVRVPAGSYTLYSVYTPGSAKLIINKQTGQWGTVYNADRDLARVDMTKETLAEPVDRFTIAIEPAADGAVLQLTWDTTRYTVPIAVR